MKLDELLSVIKDSEIEIVNKSQKCVSDGQKYYDVQKYLRNDVIDVTTRGYEKIYITIETTEERKERLRQEHKQKPLFASLYYREEKEKK